MDGKSEAANEAWSPVSSVNMNKQFQGISNSSSGWIFSVWTKRPMQEDLSVAA
jgi:hypothetical protein